MSESFDIVIAEAYIESIKLDDDAELLRNMSRSIRETGTAENEGIEAIKAYLTAR